MTDDRFNLTARERAWLAHLARGPMSWALRRQLPFGLVTLLHAGLAFRAGTLLTITPRGSDVLERVS